MGPREFFKDYKLHLLYGLVQFFVVLERFTCSYLFRVALEIIRLPIQMNQNLDIFS